MADKNHLAVKLRSAIDASGKTAYGLAKETGLGHRVIAKFLAGGDLRLDTASKLMSALGLEIRRKK